MIQIEQIRLGNYVKLTDSTHWTKEYLGKIVPVTLDEFIDAHTFPERYDPIELSPEILDKIEGIERNTDEGSVWHELHLKNGITIIEGDKNGYCEMVIYIHGKELRCRYLHVLQNWVYFFSQGQQELTINL